jgi:hypothetical protein
MLDRRHVHYLSDSLIAQPPAERIDALLVEISTQYRALPKHPELALRFREALAHLNLPGGYARAGRVALSLSESLQGEVQC